MDEELPTDTTVDNKSYEKFRKEQKEIMANAVEPKPKDQPKEIYVEEKKCCCDDFGLRKVCCGLNVYEVSCIICCHVSCPAFGCFLCYLAATNQLNFD